MGQVKTYSKALFSVAEEEGKIHPFLEELKNIILLLQANEKLKIFFNNPIVPKKAKKDLIKKALSQKISHEMTNFLFLLIDQNVQDLLEEIFEDYTNHYRKSKDLLYVKVTTKVKLKDEEKQNLKSNLDKLFKKNTIIDYIIDESILGGILITTEEKSIDLTFKSKLKQIREEIFKENIYELSDR